MNAQANNAPALIIFDTITMQRPRGLEGSYASMRGAKTALTAHKKRLAAAQARHDAEVERRGFGEKSKKTVDEIVANLVVGTYADFAKMDYDVPTHNMLNPEAGEFMIKRSMKGTSCDPATERYHTL